MIHEILLSDVELARSMIGASHSDAEILACLSSRGIESAKASALVDDLRHGRRPIAQFPFAPAPGTQATGTKSPTAIQDAPAPPPAKRHHSHRGKHRRGVIPRWFIFLVLIFIGALGWALYKAGLAITSNAAEQDKHEVPLPFRK